MWQSKTFMNTETRASGISPSPSSGGGTTRTTGSTRPSAGLTTSPGAIGHDADRIAEEDRHPAGKDEQQPGKRLDEEGRDDREDERGADKGQPSRCTSGIASRMERAILIHGS